MNATAVVITFTVNNYHDQNDPGLAKAMAWETKFIEYVEDYVANKAEKNGMTIAYSSEVSQQNVWCACQICLKWVIQKSYFISHGLPCQY